jgi:hypothetical protein
MPRSDAASWCERVSQVLSSYDAALLREVASRLVRSRGQWPLEELTRRCVHAIATPSVIDRRLKGLHLAERRLLALIGHSSQPRWPVGSLVEMNIALGEADGLDPVRGLLRAGLLYPEVGPGCRLLRDFDTWLTQTTPAALCVFAHPGVTARLVGQDLGLPNLAAHGKARLDVGLAPGPVQEADGLEWPLRLAALCQLLKAGPLRLTQQGDFFKRDLDRLRQDGLLGATPADSPVEIPDVALLVVALALAENVVVESDGELQVGALPASWEKGLATAITSLWAALPRLIAWGPEDGWRLGQRVGNPYPAAYLLALLLLARLPQEAWTTPETVAGWLATHHPFWQGPEPARTIEGNDNAPRRAPPQSLQAGVSCFLLGLGYQLSLVQATRAAGGGWLVRLSAMGRHVLGIARPPAVPAFAQTLLVQPNLEILAYRQGMTPALAACLGRFAAWKSLGAACTLQLRPDTVYAALEEGETAETILEALREHGTRVVPPTVAQVIKSWATKRERISVYAAATLFEFASSEDLESALARGLPAARLSERMAAVASETDVDFRHFRLTATRDYSLPPERCLSVAADGVTFIIDPGRADLLLESEVQRFAEPLERPGAPGKGHYRLTPASAAAARAAGLTGSVLETWFQQRSGQALPAAARLLLAESPAPASQLRRRLVLHVANAEVADGLAQWPGTRALVEERLGPTVLAVAEENAALLQDRLAQLGIPLAVAPVNGLA